MGHVKKEYYDAVIGRLEQERREIQSRMARNKRTINELAAKQHSLKKQRIILQNLINGIRNQC